MRDIRSVNTYVHLYCHKHGYETLSDHPVLLWSWQDGFDFAAISSHSKVVNLSRMRIHTLVYNLFNWFRWLVPPANMRKQQVDTIRLKLIKITAKAVRSGRYITFKLCNSFSYKKGILQHTEKYPMLNCTVGITTINVP